MPLREDGDGSLRWSYCLRALSVEGANVTQTHTCCELCFRRSHIHHSGLAFHLDNIIPNENTGVLMTSIRFHGLLTKRDVLFSVGGAGAETGQPKFALQNCPSFPPQDIMFWHRRGDARKKPILSFFSHLHVFSRACWQAWCITGPMTPSTTWKAVWSRPGSSEDQIRCGGIPSWDRIRSPFRLSTAGNHAGPSSEMVSSTPSTSELRLR